MDDKRRKPKLRAWLVGAAPVEDCVSGLTRRRGQMAGPGSITHSHPVARSGTPAQAQAARRDHENVIDQPPGTVRAARRVVASFRTYREAEAAVDRLSDRGFDVDRAAIVARDLSLVEEVTGRTTTLRAGLSGALNGTLVGAALGWILGIFNWADPVVSATALAFYGMIAGAIVGAIAGFVVQLSTGGRRDFTSVSAVRAARYDVMVEEAHADRALELL